MKCILTSLSFFLIVLLFSQCNSNSNSEDNNKDLRQNMGDMGMYHDNLGTELRNGNADNASWLLQGLDSSLKVIAAKFEQHRKLSVPFEQSYRERLQPYIIDISKSLGENNFSNAVKAYRLLTNNCNSCHKDNNIDEEVLDLTDTGNF